MHGEILTGIFSLIASLVGTFGGIITSTKLTNYQINELKKRVGDVLTLSLNFMTKGC